MSTINSMKMGFAPELIASMTGTPVVIGVLQFPPAVMYFDNLSTVSVVISVNGVQWKTFSAGTALSIDCRTNKGSAADFCPSVGDVITGNGASGQFSVAYTYPKNQ